MMQTFNDSEMVTYPQHRIPSDLFQSCEIVKACAPMVRFSRLVFVVVRLVLLQYSCCALFSSLPFRKLVRKYGCDLTFTPMIVAESFVQSSSARENDFDYDLGFV